jgi:hypothetical protein
MIIEILVYFLNTIEDYLLNNNLIECENGKWVKK